MPRSQPLFYCLFFGLFLGCMLFGEMPIGIVIFGLISILYLLYQLIPPTRFNIPSWQNNRIQSAPHLLAAILLSLFFFSTFLSVFFTQSIPLTLNKWVLVSLGVLTFDFFYSSDRREFPLLKILSGMLSIGIIVGILGSVFFVFPQLAQQLPSMNLIFTTYGHSHAAIVYLFCLPIAFLFAKRRQFRWWSLLPIFFLVGVMLETSARFDLALAGLELVLLTVCHLPIRWRKKLNHWQVVVGMIVFAGVSLFGLFQFTQPATWNICFFANLNQKICKQSATEFRWEYWQQAVQGIAASPLIGWGGGTFQIVSMRKATSPEYFTAFAHNEYLQLLSEYGALSLPFFLFLGYVWTIGIRRKFDLDQPATYLWLAFASLCLNALVDFDWNFSAIWLLLFLSAGVLLRDSDLPPNFIQKWNQWCDNTVLAKLSSVSFLAGFIFIQLWVVGFLVSTMIWNAGNHELSVLVFPMAPWRAQQIAFNTKQKSLLDFFYPNDVAVLEGLLRNPQLPVTQKIELAQKVRSISRFDLANTIQLLTFAQQTQNQQLYLDTLTVFRQTYQGQQAVMLTSADKKNFFDLVSANITAISSVNLPMATQQELQLWQIDHGLAVEHPFFPFQNPQNYAPQAVKDSIDDLSSTDLVNSAQSSLTTWLLSQIQIEIQQQNWSMSLKDVSRIIHINPGSSWKTWQTVSVATQTQLTLTQKNSITTSNWEALQTWFQTWQLIHQSANPNVAVNFDDQVSLVKKLVTAGNSYYLAGDMTQAIQLYSQAQQVLPYFDAKSHLVIESGPVNLHLFEAFITTLIPSKSANLSQPILQREAFRKPLQLLANVSVKQHDWAQAAFLLNTLSINFSQDYFASAQLGNFYSMQGEDDLARQFFANCQTHFVDPASQTDCYWGMQDLIIHYQPKLPRYLRISQQILGNSFLGI